MLLQHLLILLTAIWIFRKTFQHFRLPSLFGEIFAGFIIGPMVLGWVTDTEAILVLAELGVFFLMFHAGLEFSPKDFLRTFKSALWIALAGLLIPIGAIYGISAWFGFDPFVSAFIALALSASAVEISTRMFKDSKLGRTKMVQTVITSSIVIEVLVLLFFSVYLDIFQTRAFDPAHLFTLGLKVFGYFWLALWVGRKGSHYLHRFLYKGNKGFTLSLIIALLFAVFAEFIGLHFIIGAFLAGVFLQRELIDIEMYDKLEDRVFGLGYSFLGPVFFASLAFHLDFRALLVFPAFAIALFITAVLSKFVGTAMMAFWKKHGFLTSCGIGLSMNNRGALALVFISIGLHEKIISADLFSMLVFIVLGSTFFTLLTFKLMARKLKASSHGSSSFDDERGQQMQLLF